MPWEMSRILRAGLVQPAAILNSGIILGVVISKVLDLKSRGDQNHLPPLLSSNPV